MKNSFLILISGIILIGCVQAQEPTRWRGPNANGVYPETGLLNEWPANGPEIIWHYDELGKGFSSPALANDKIYISGMEGSTGYIYVLTKEGKLFNKFKYGEEFTESFPGSRSTPTIVGDLLYMYSGHGQLVCMDANSGSVKWSKNVFDDFDGQNIRWGVTESPVVDGDKIYITPGGKENNVVALNRFDGSLIWSCAANGELSAYCTPLIVELPSRKILVTMMASHIIGIDANTGQFLWSYHQPNQWSVHANTPVYHDGSILCTSGYGQGSVKLSISSDGSKIEKEWFNSSIDNRIGGMVYLDGYAYGSGDKNRNWYCVDWKSGENKYADSSLGLGVVIAADGKLFCYSDRGELAMVKADPAGYKILSKTKVSLGSEQHWAHPVIDDGRLYLRHGSALIIYKIK